MEKYFSICSPGSYNGVQALYKLMKGKMTKKEIVKWLAKQDASTLHKPIRRHFPHQKVYARDIDYLWQADLVDMTHWTVHNDELSLHPDGDRYVFKVCLGSCIVKERCTNGSRSV